MKKENRIAFRVTEQEKKRITVLARKCGLSVSEYIKQRALGYAPQPVLPEVIFPLLEKIGQLQDLTAEKSNFPRRHLSAHTSKIIPYTAALPEFAQAVLKNA